VTANFVTDPVDDAFARVVQRLTVIADTATETFPLFLYLAFFANRGSHQRAWDLAAVQPEATALVCLIDNLLAGATLWRRWYLARILDANQS